MAFASSGSKFQSTGWRKNKDGPIEEWRHTFRGGVVVLNIQNGLNSYWLLSVTAHSPN